MKTAIYIRVSTEEQAKEGFSIRAQKERLANFVSSQDWDVHDYYLEEGVSAKDMVRPELSRMIKDIEQGHVEVVLVYRLDRLTRSVRDLYNMLDLFEKHGCKFKSATEVYDTTTAMGRLFITLVAALAQWERENLGERVRMGMERMINEGNWHGGIVPYGYRYNDRSKNLEVNEDEEEIVNTIFDKYTKGLGEHKVAKFLRERGHKTRNGFDWTSKAVRDILTNPIACGNLRWGDEIYKNFVDPIIDDDLFLQAKKIRESRRLIHPRAAGTSQYPFSGVLKCSRCGRPLKGRETTGRLKNDGTRTVFRRYICLGVADHGCKLKEINEKAVEEAFLNKLNEYIEDYKAMVKEETQKVKKVNKSDKKINHLKSQIKKIQDRKRKWQLAYADEAITLEELKERTKEDKELQGELEKELDQINVSKNTNNPQDMIGALIDFKANWIMLDKGEQKTALQIFVEFLSIDAEDRRGTKKELRKANIVDIKFK
jgi:site-specific DNA recombinase